MLRYALMIAAPAAAIAAGSAAASFSTFNGQAPLTPGQWEQALTLGGLTFAVCFVAALPYFRVLRAPRPAWARFVYGALFGLGTMATVVIAYSAMNSGGDFVTALLAYADITFWFGGMFVPLLAGLGAAALGARPGAGTPAVAPDAAPPPA